jgi:SAM-dependent methyltransferase
MSDAINQYYKDYYDKMGSAAYLGENLKTSSRMLAFVDLLAHLPDGAKVLDIGCGDAVFAELMPRFDWYGMDINTSRAVKRNIKLADHDLMVKPYPYADSTFDAIITSEVLEHLWTPATVHQEAARLIKRNGTYVVSTPNFNWIMHHLANFSQLLYDDTKSWVREHINQFDAETHTKYLRQSGFSVEKVQGADAHYCALHTPLARRVVERLKEKGLDVPETEVHKWFGEGLPHFQHTVILKAKKL